MIKSNYFHKKYESRILGLTGNASQWRTWPQWYHLDASISTLDAILLALCTVSPPTETGDNGVLHDSSPLVKGTQAVTPRISHREGVFSQSGVHRRVPDRVGGTVWWSSNEKVVDCGKMQALHQLFGTVRNLFGSETFPFQTVMFWSEQTIKQWFLT